MSTYAKNASAILHPNRPNSSRSMLYVKHIRIVRNTKVISTYALWNDVGRWDVCAPSPPIFSSPNISAGFCLVNAEFGTWSDRHSCLFIKAFPFERRCCLIPWYFVRCVLYIYEVYIYPIGYFSNGEGTGVLRKQKNWVGFIFIPSAPFFM